MLDPHRLDGLPFFDGISARARRELAARAVERAYAAGEILFLAGQPATGLHVVTSGRVRVMRGALAGGGGARRHVVHIEVAGGTLGEVPLLAGGGYPATAEAMEPTTCILLGREALEAAVAADVELAWLLLARLATRVRTLVGRLDSLMLRSVTARLAALLLERAHAARGDIVTLGMTQHAAAEYLGTAREVLVRSLRELRDAGALEPVGAGRYRVLDAEMLRRVSADGAG